MEIYKPLFMGFIYAHINKINGMTYVGQTQQKNPADRFANGKGYPRNKVFNNAIKKHTWGNFDHIILEKIEAKSKNEIDMLLVNAEIKYINLYNSFYPNGYNLASPVYNGGQVVSDLTRQKMSMARKGKKLSEEHRKNVVAALRRNNPKLGKTLSEESKKKIGLANKGRLAGRNNPMWGKKRQDVSARNLLGSKSLYQIHQQSNEIVHVWNSLRECARETGWGRNDIRNCCIGKTKLSHGFRWVFADKKIEGIKGETKNAV